MSIWTPSSWRCRINRSVCSCVIAEGDDHPFDVETPGRCSGSSSCEPSTHTLPFRSVPFPFRSRAVPRLGVDEAEHVEAVLGVLGELAGDKLTDVATPTMTVFWR